MSVRRKGNQWQADVMIHGTRYRKSFHIARDAENWETELKRRKSLGLDLDELVETDDRITLDEAMDKTWAKFWKNTDSDYGNFQKMKEIMTYFPRDLLLADISTTMIDEFMDWLEEKGNAPATINNKINILSKTFRWAKSRDKLDKAPHIDRKKITRGKPRFFSDVDVGAICSLLSDADTPRIVKKLPNSLIMDYFRFGLESGMRSEEITSLSISEQLRNDPTLGPVVDLEETKNELYRCNPLTSEMKQILARYEGIDQPFLGMTQKTRYAIWSFIRKALDNYDIEWIMYLTRHTCASRLVQAGVNLLAVQKYMGHRKIETTMLYATLRPSDLMACSDALNNRTAVSPKLQLTA